MRLLLALLLATCMPAVSAEHPTRKAARMHAMEDIQRVAVKAGMPTGLFGVKWLMTPKEVIYKKEGDVKISQILIYRHN